MAKKNMRDEFLKPQVTENEQMGDIVLVLDKMELLLQAVSKLDKDGRYETMAGIASSMGKAHTEYGEHWFSLRNACGNEDIPLLERTIN